MGALQVWCLHFHYPKMLFCALGESHLDLLDDAMRTRPNLRYALAHFGPYVNREFVDFAPESLSLAVASAAGFARVPKHYRIDGVVYPMHKNPWVKSGLLFRDLQQQRWGRMAH